MIVVLMPMSAPLRRVQPWIITLWAMLTSSSMTVGHLPLVTWMTQASWMLVRAPMRIQFTSPRTTQLNQMEASSPISTSPSTRALSATKTRLPSFGTMPWKGRIMGHLVLGAYPRLLGLGFRLLLAPTHTSPLC